MCEELLRDKPHKLVNSNIKVIQLQQKFSLTSGLFLGKNVNCPRTKKATLLSKKYEDEILDELRKNIDK